MKEQLMEKIRQIVEDEKFKLDAAFLCGAAVGLPDQPLMRACQAYLDAPEDPEAKAALITRLEAAVNGKSAHIRGDLTDNAADIREVYENRQYL